MNCNQYNAYMLATVNGYGSGCDLDAQADAHLDTCPHCDQQAIQEVQEFSKKVRGLIELAGRERVMQTWTRSMN